MTMDALTPAHQACLNRVRQCLQQRQPVTARQELEQLVAEAPGLMVAWMQLALVSRMLDDAPAELRALQGALTANPYDLFALLVKGECLERMGRADEALRAHKAACAVALSTDVEALGSEVQRLLRRAQTAVNRKHQALGSALDRWVATEAAGLQGAIRERFEHAVDILVGRRTRFDPQPMGLYYPSIVQCEFFPRERFPWLAELEAQTEAIRAELMGLLARNTGSVPYVQYDSDQPMAQWAPLNRNPDWSVFHLIKEGLRVPENADQCPVTMATLARFPQPQQAGRTPVALFSCLKPHTRIPPHVGVSNARLLVHLPLIVPPHCGFRVGSQTRPWRVGEAFVFDDSVEHEAWNDSDELRVVLIFDVWHPDLTVQEQRLLDGLARVQDAVSADGTNA